MPMVSVVIPTYNRAAKCTESVTSILNQTFNDYEIIVVDDGSTDGTKEALSSAFGDRIRYFRQNNAGASVARNQGILEATGEFISFCDSDDVFMPTHLEELVSFLRAFPELGFVFADLEMFNEAGTILRSRLRGKAIDRVPVKEFPRGRLVHDRVLFLDLLHGSFVPLSTIVARRTCFATAGLFDSGYRFLNDADLMMRLAKHFRAGHINKVLARGYVGTDNLTAKRWTEVRFRHKLRLLRKVANQELSPDELRAISEQRRRTSFDFGSSLFNNGKMAEARRCFAMNLFAGERIGRAWPLFLATFLPTSLAHWLRGPRRRNYRSVTDMRSTILANLHRVPEDTGVVVGVPRSGMLPALLIGLYKHLPVIDLEAFLEGRTPDGGRRMAFFSDAGASANSKVLIVDDSILTGAQMQRVRERVSSSGINADVVYLAVYGRKTSNDLVDLIFEDVPPPRVFEWNIFHHSSTEEACFDMDGVLCRDATKSDTATPEAYSRFLETTEPKLIPRSKVGWVVTSRLEVHREATEAWLSRHRVDYGELIMWDTVLTKKASPADRAAFKSSVYKRLPSSLFVESSKVQAKLIARSTGRPVFSVDTQEMVTAMSPRRFRYLVKAQGRRILRSARRKLRPVVRKFVSSDPDGHTARINDTQQRS